MILGAASWLTEGALIVGSLTTFAAALAGFLKSRPGRWLMRQFSEEIQHFVGDIAERVATRTLEKHQDAQESYIADRIEELFNDELDARLVEAISPVLYELRSNGGGSFRDETIAMLAEIAEFMEGSRADRRDLRINLGNLRQIVETEIHRSVDRDDAEDERREHPE